MLDGVDRCRVIVERRQERLDLLSGDDHIEKMRRDAATFKRNLSPAPHGEGVELAEVGRSFDRSTSQSESCRLSVIMDACMAAVLLVGKHLCRTSKRPGQSSIVPDGDLRLKRHASMVACSNAKTGLGYALPLNAALPSEMVHTFFIFEVQGSRNGTQAMLAAERFDFVHSGVDDNACQHIECHTRLGSSVRRVVDAGEFVGDGTAGDLGPQQSIGQRNVEVALIDRPKIVGFEQSKCGTHD